MNEILLHLSSPLQGVALAGLDASLPVSAAPLERPIPTMVHRPGSADPERDQPATSEHEAIQRVLSGLSQAASNLDTRRCQLLCEMQRVAVELAVAVAARLVHQKIEAGDFAVETLVREMVERLGSPQPTIVRLHPEDVALLERRLGGHPLSIDNETVRLIADPALERGDCRAEAGDVSLLSQLESQLADIRQHLLRSAVDAEVERRKATPGDRNLRRFPDRRQTA